LGMQACHEVRGKKHTYLVMQLEYMNDGKCIIGIISYKEEIIDSFPHMIDKTPTTPAADLLLKVREDPTGHAALPEEQYFLEALGYLIKKNLIYQDNKSIITLTKNDKASSSKHTKHINVSYFFVKDCIVRR
jgi:hypothetical protein